MSSLSECSDVEQTRSTTNDGVNMFFVEFLKNKRILLDKRKAPNIKKKKNVVLAQLKAEYERTFGKVILIPQIKKKIINIKARLKEKCDVKKTGNKKIRLKPWEKELHELLNCDKLNPLLNKSAGSIAGGTNLNQRTDTDPIDMFSTLENTSSSLVSAKDSTNVSRSLIQKVDSAHILSKYETSETQSLSLSDLRRLVLLKQNLLVEKKLKLADKELSTGEMVENVVKKEIDFEEF